jgi:pimeloyl-ACP methyl ester carboxylesterase
MTNQNKVDKNTFKENGNINFIVEGAGSAVILVHGFAASNNDWIYLQPDLVDQGYQVIAPDLIGHGSSQSKLSEQYSFDLLYSQFSEWSNALNLNGPHAIIGHSMGGLISLNYAIRNPDRVSNLVLINPYYDKNQLNPWLRKVINNPGLSQSALESVPSWLINMYFSLDIKGLLPADDQVKQQKAEDITRADPEIVHFLGSIPDIANHLSEVQSPTLVIWGMKDPTLNPDSFQQLVDSIPNAIGRAIPECGHQPHLEEAEQLSQMVTNFIAGHPLN